MKCGYFKYEEFRNPIFNVRYTCNYFGFSCNTEKGLCEGCHLDKVGVPHLDGWEEEDDE